MTQLSTREQRALSRLRTSSGHLLVVAADQRNSMKTVMSDHRAGADSGADSVSTAQLAQAKADLVACLANHAPAVLLDPQVAVPMVIDDGVLSASTGLVIGMDDSGFEVREGLRYTSRVPGVTARRLVELGADAAKMLYYLRPDVQGTNSVAAQQITALVEECSAEGLLLVVEILVYRLEHESVDDYKARFPELVAQAARLAVACGAKVLKLQYPGSPEACRAVTAAAQGVPWAVLSAGVDHATFVDQVRQAVAGGASGAMAGRALWKDSLSLDAGRRATLLTERALPRLRELTRVLAEPGSAASDAS